MTTDRAQVATPVRPLLIGLGAFALIGLVGMVVNRPAPIPPSAEEIARDQLIEETKAMLIPARVADRRDVFFDVIDVVPSSRIVCGTMRVGYAMGQRAFFVDHDKGLTMWQGDPAFYRLRPFGCDAIMARLKAR